jgi:hypothetical protein
MHTGSIPHLPSTGKGFSVNRRAPNGARNALTLMWVKNSKQGKEIIQEEKENAGLASTLNRNG